MKRISQQQPDSPDSGIGGLDELLQRLQRDDLEQDWARFIAHEAGWLEATARLHLDRIDLVDDCVQDTILTVRRLLPGYRPGTESESRSWLRTVAVGVARNLCRSTTARRRREWQYAREHQGPARHLPDERREAIRQALLALPASQRQVIELRYFYGLTTHQMARELQQNPEATKRRLSRALAGLRRRLGMSGGTAPLLLLLDDFASVSEGQLAPALDPATAGPANPATTGLMKGSFLAGLAALPVVALGVGAWIWMAAADTRAESGDPAPGVVWQRIPTGCDHACTGQVAVDRAGNIHLAAGVLVSAADPARGPTGRKLAASFTLVKRTDPTGRTLWTHRVDARMLNALAVDPTGRSALAVDRRLLALSPAGEPLWEQVLPELDARPLVPLSLACPADGSGILLAGLVGTAAGTGRLWLLKYDWTGAERWRRPGVSEGRCHRRVELRSGGDGAIVVVSCPSLGVSRSPPPESMSVEVLDAEGRPRWRDRVEGIRPQAVSDVAIDAAGRVIVAGLVGSAEDRTRSTVGMVRAWEPSGRRGRQGERELAALPGPPVDLAIDPGGGWWIHCRPPDAARDGDLVFRYAADADGVPVGPAWRVRLPTRSPPSAQPGYRTYWGSRTGCHDLVVDPAGRLVLLDLTLSPEGDHQPCLQVLQPPARDGP